MLIIVESVGFTIYQSYCPITDKTTYALFQGDYCCELSVPVSCCDSIKAKDCCDIEPKTFGFNADGASEYNDAVVPVNNLDQNLLPFLITSTISCFNKVGFKEYFNNYDPPPKAATGWETILKKQTFLI